MRRAGFEHDEVRSRVEGVGRAGHRLDREADAVDRIDPRGVGRVHLHPRATLVERHRDTGSGIRHESHLCHLAVTSKTRERVIDEDIADRLMKVVREVPYSMAQRYRALVIEDL